MNDRASSDAGAVKLAVYAAASFCVVYLSMIFVRMFHSMLPVLPSGAMILAMFLSAPERRRWVYLASGALAYGLAGYAAEPQAIVGANWSSPLILDLCNLSGVLVAYGLIRRVAGQRALDFAAPRDLALFIFAAGVGAPTATVLVGALIVGLFGHLASATGSLIWWGGDCLGMLIVAPALLTLRNMKADISQLRVTKGGVAALVLLFGVSLAVFIQRELELRYLIPPALALVALSMEFIGVAVGGVIVAAVAMTAFLLHQGVAPPQLHVHGPIERLLLLQAFLIFLMATNLPFAALLAQRRRLQESLIRAQSETEAARAEAVEQQRRSAMAEEMAHVGFWRADFRTGAMEWSDQNYVIFGRDRNAPTYVGLVGVYTHPEDQADRVAAFNSLKQGQSYTHAWRAIREDGEIRHVVSRGVPEFDEDGKVRGAFGTVSDVTDLTRAEVALAQSAARLRLITENIADIIFQTDLDDRVTFISPSVEARLGYKPEEVLGASWLDLLHPDDAPLWAAARQRLSSTKHGAEPDSIRCRARANDGREVWLALRPSLVFDEKTGAPVGVVDMARDVTERIRLMSELNIAREVAEKAAEVKGEFLANMSHEIRTPLTTISGFTHLAQGQADLDADTRRYIDRIASAASALLAIVNDVLDFSKLEAGEIRLQPRPTPVEAVMSETMDLFSGQSAEKGVSLTLDYAQDVPARLVVDPDRLRQILINLTGNGMKFTEAGGVRLAAAYNGEAQTLRIEVADSGPGIPADRLNLLFQRFSQVDGSTTRRFGGTGLGLAICKGLVEAMGGQIGVESQPGEGARFWFSIPAPRAEEIEGPAVADAGVTLLDGLRLLVVDDNAVNRELVRAVLTPLGAEVSEAEDGAHAVELAGAQVFDVILMDLRMPGMSGIQTTQAILGGSGPNAGTPIVAFSADAGEEAGLGPLMAHGFCARVIKPFKPMDLILVLASARELNATQAGRDVA